jgi:hypothetical protein
MALLTPGTSSHALTEVLIQKGWMAVDPDIPWIGLTNDLTVVSVRALQENAGKDYVWHNLAKTDHNDILKSDFSYVVGLYSRHGRFYPPYNPIPDINYPQFIFNIFAFAASN